jgi:hypothetical protein
MFHAPSFTVDTVKQQMTVGAGPFVLVMSFKDPVHKNMVFIEEVLDKTFTIRRVFWLDPRKEKVPWTLKSLEEVRALLDGFRRPFGENARRHHRDRLYYQFLTRWWVATTRAIQSLQDAIEDERDPINTGMDMSVNDFLPSILVGVRRPAWVAVAALADALPDGHRARVEAERLLTESKDFSLRELRLGLGTLESDGKQLQRALQTGVLEGED